MAAHGYAVLLPDPALSTGYGREFVTRGWGRWGAEPYTDLLALTDAAERPPGHRRRPGPRRWAARSAATWPTGSPATPTASRAIVTHASLWALDQFGPTTDAPDYWRRELTPRDARREHSPHRHVDAIRTPMLVIHGDRDYRVPIGEALRLWSELRRPGAPTAGCRTSSCTSPTRTTGCSRRSTPGSGTRPCSAFLDHHLRGADWVVPDLLR